MTEQVLILKLGFNICCEQLKCFKVLLFDREICISVAIDKCSLLVGRIHKSLSRLIKLCFTEINDLFMA